MNVITDPRSADLYAVVLRLVAEQGFDHLTMDLIALESGRSKPALYGRWGGRVGIIVAAVSHHHGLDEPLPNTGTLPGDLAALQARQSRTGADPAVITATIHAMNEDDELADALRTTIIAPGRARVRELLQRSLERGEIEPSNPALPYVDLLLLAPTIIDSIGGSPESNKSHASAFHANVLLPALGIT